MPPARWRGKNRRETCAFAFASHLSTRSSSTLRAGRNECRRHRSNCSSELLDRFPEDGSELVGRIKDREHEGDRLTHEIVDLLNRTFVTPFDRDDMYRLAGALDDICDHIDEAADNIDLYGVKVIPEGRRAAGAR